MKRIILGLVMVLVAGVCWGQQPAVIIPSFDLVDGATQRERDTITGYSNGTTLLKEPRIIRPESLLTVS